MRSFRSEEKLKTIWERTKRELLHDPRPNNGKSTLAIGAVLGLVWLFLIYTQPGYPWLNAKFLVGAVCFGAWGIADVLPHRLRWISVFLRALVLVFMTGLGVWITIDLIASF